MNGILKKTEFKHVDEPIKQRDVILKTQKMAKEARKQQGEKQEMVQTPPKKREKADKTKQQERWRSSHTEGEELVKEDCEDVKKICREDNKMKSIYHYVLYKNEYRNRRENQINGKYDKVRWMIKRQDMLFQKRTLIYA